MKKLLTFLLLLCVAVFVAHSAIADVNADGTAVNKVSEDTIREFHSAVAAGDRRMAEKMIAIYPELVSALYPDADPGKPVEPVFTAIDHHQADMLDLLLKHGASYVHGSTGQTPLDRATVFGNVDVVKTLLDAGADVNGLDDPAKINELEDPTHGTPLRDAVGNEHLEIARLLVQRGARVDIQSAAGLGWTSWVTEQITAHPELIDVSDGWRYKPVCYAVAGGCAGTAEVLLSHGADVGHTYDDGQTLLQLATATGYHDVMAVLLAHSANINAKNKAGETAVDYAIKYKQEDAAEFLREHGGKRGSEI